MMHHPSVHPSVQELVHSRGNKRIVECSQLGFIRTAATGCPIVRARTIDVSTAPLQCRVVVCIHTK